MGQSMCAAAYCAATWLTLLTKLSKLTAPGLCPSTRTCSKWMERQGVCDRMPTQQELRRSGANTLSARIDSHGGLAGAVLGKGW